MGYVSSQWHTRQPQAPQQLAAISWCRSPAYRTTERAVSMPRSTEGKNTQKTRKSCGKNTQKTRKSSAPRPYIGYVSSQWHTRRVSGHNKAIREPLGTRVTSKPRKVAWGTFCKKVPKRLHPDRLYVVFNSIWITKDLGFGLISARAFQRCAGLD